MKHSIVKFLGQSCIAVKPCELKLEAAGEGWDRHAEWNFPNEPILITKLNENTKKVLYLQYYSKSHGLTQIVVPNGLQVTKVTGKQRKDLMEIYKTNAIDNIRRNLGAKPESGSDPEIFVEDDKGNIIPAFDFLSSKEKPDKTAAICEGQRIRGTPKVCGQMPMYWDGFQAEFTTSSSDCLGWHVDSVQCGLRGVLMKAREHNPKAKLSIQTVAEIPYDLIKNGKEEHVQFGCMPSFNAYGLKGLSISGREVTYRSAGGHIHFGQRLNQEQCVKAVKALDAILGVACVSLFAKYDNPKRRTMYGLAGEYRMPPHGLEYRTLSNAWLFHPTLMNMVFDLGRKAYQFGLKDYMYLWKTTEKETINVIQTCDVKGARKILKNNKDIIIELLKSCYTFDVTPIYNAFLNGMETIIKDPSDIEGNWNLSGDWKGHSDGKGKSVQYSIEEFKKKNKVA